MATGNPQPEITWKKNGRPIELGSLVQSDQSLLIPALNLEEHRGEYICEATNIAG
jgi:hypothetical protein